LEAVTKQPRGATMMAMTYQDQVLNKGAGKTDPPLNPKKKKKGAGRSAGPALFKAAATASVAAAAAAGSAAAAAAPFADSGSAGWRFSSFLFDVSTPSVLFDFSSPSGLRFLLCLNKFSTC
jgi:hypothetical protein